MSHPVGKYISKHQNHELEHWLRKWNCRQTQDNRDILISMIDAAKSFWDKDPAEHLAHQELDLYFVDHRALWTFE